MKYKWSISNTDGLCTNYFLDGNKILRTNRDKRVPFSFPKGQSSTDWHQHWPLTSLSPLVGLSCSCLEKEHWAVGKCCTSSCAMKGTSLVRELVQKRPLPWFALPCLGNESSITFKCNCTPTLIYCCLPLTISANHSVEIGIVIETP